MTKLARVIYAYRPKNDDELELNVDDKIEFMGVEEEGWWKGKLKGRIGVFPSNFVVIETGSPSTTQSSTTNKLNSIFGSKVLSKNSISSNSLNSINNNGGSNKLTNNNNSSSNSNLIMNNTQPEIDSTSDHPFSSADESFHSASSANERRPKPIRGNGFGDIFAAGAKLKPLPVDAPKPAALASERMSTIATNMASTLQKPIPKKPPPPAPATDSNPNGSSSDQAPALPPKPNNQVSPFMQPISRPPPPSTVTNLQANAPQVREQARVLFAYKASNPDELDIEAGDIITVLDKKIDDVGWWRGVLNGKVGVFPDNFVELIKVSEDWQSNSARASSANQQNTLGFIHQHQPPPITENKIKSVFASTPKGFSKELENNLEKHGNPASFLSLKRNKLQQQQVMSETACDPAIATATLNDANNKTHEPDTIGPLETNSVKLNHITANRAKGPSRRPPSNVLNKRNGQSAESPGKRETNGRGDEFALGSLPVHSNSNSNLQSQINNQESLSSLPIGQQIVPGAIGSALFLPNIKSENNKSPVPNKSSLPVENVIDNQQVMGSKSNQRPQPQPIATAQPLIDKITTSPPSRPPWMIELRKSNLEKKRDSSVSSIDEITTRNSKTVEPLTTPSNVDQTPQTVAEVIPSLSPSERKNSVQSLRETYNPTVTTVKSISSRYSSNELNNANSNQVPGTESPKASLLSGTPVINLQPQNSLIPNELSSSPITDRSNNLFNKASPTKSEVAPIANINENGNNTTLVPSNINKSPSVLPNSNLAYNNDVNIQKSNTECSPNFEKSPQAAINRISAPVGQQQINDEECKFIMTKTQYDNLLMQISKNLTSEISELKNEVKQLQKEFKGVDELKTSLEAMKIELKTCQNATENQKRYIKELVNNLADERKKIASMQGEIERNLK